MPSITVTRTGKIQRPTGGGPGEGKITSGIIDGNFASVLAIPAGSLGLSSIDRVYLSPGTALEIDARADVRSRGSPGNTVRITAVMTQRIRVGSITTTRSYVSYSPAFTGTPSVLISLGSPNGTVSAGSPPSIAYVQNQLSGSAAIRRLGGSPIANRENRVVARGPGSFPLHYLAIGD